MCGIAGIFARHCDHALDVEAISRKMVNTIGYRGPDAEGFGLTGLVGLLWHIGAYLF